MQKTGWIDSETYLMHSDFEQMMLNEYIRLLHTMKDIDDILIAIEKVVK